MMAGYFICLVALSSFLAVNSEEVEKCFENYTRQENPDLKKFSGLWTVGAANYGVTNCTRIALTYLLSDSMPISIAKKNAGQYVSHDGTAVFSNGYFDMTVPTFEDFDSFIILGGDQDFKKWALIAVCSDKGNPIKMLLVIRQSDQRDSAIKESQPLVDELKITLTNGIITPQECEGNPIPESTVP